MRRRVLAVLGCVITLSGMAYGQAMIQGNWEGQFTKGDLKGTPLSAKIIGESDTDYLVELTVGNNTELQLHGKTENGMTTFYGGVDLKDSGGRQAVTAFADNGVMEGTFASSLTKSSAFEMKRVEKKSPTLGKEPPAGAVVLMDGTNLDKWTRDPIKWNLLPDGATEVTGSNFRTIEELGSGLYHVEFRTPYKPDERGQGRGNSGVYILGRYEVQVLDSYGLPPADNEAGGIYKEATPLVNASLPPTEWQTYDIDFAAPEFDANGKKIKNARITVQFNGVVVHNDAELSNLTPGGVSGTEAPKGPLMFQDHHNNVRYRNVWYLPK